MNRPAPTAGPLDGLTALRFFAALAVMLFHYFTQYMPAAGQRHGLELVIGHGYTGVTFFFMLSGFILAYTYAEADFSRPAAVARYLQARVARIMPLYLLSLVVAAPIYADALINSQPDLYLTLFGTAPVLAPLALQAWVPGAAASINFPTWSVSNEAFFYVMFPLLLPVLLLRPVRWLAAAGLYMVVLWALTVWLWGEFGAGLGLMDSTKGAPPITRLVAQFIKFFPLCHLHEFVAGMLLHVLWRRGGWRWSGPALLAGGAALFLALTGLTGMVPDPVDHNGPMILPLSLLILGGANIRDGWPGPLVFLGKASYGMYLFHAPLYQGMRWLDDARFHSALAGVRYLYEAIALAAVIALASWLHLAVEEPMRRRIMRWRPGPAAPAGADARPRQPD